MRKRTFPPSVQPGIPRIIVPKKGWSRQNIGDLFEVVSRPANIQDNQRYRLITVRRSRGGLDQRSELYGRDIAVKSQFLVETGDFLISKRQIVHGACGIVPSELDRAIVSNEYAVLRCSHLLDPRYLQQLIHSVYLQQTFFHSSIGVHIEKMIFKLPEWFKWPIHLPTLPEQRKIAGFLSAVDEKIAHLSRKKALLEDYKKGCMQQLFSQKIRFKDDDGNNFPDWEEKRLGEVADCLDNKRKPLNSTEREQMKGNVPYYGANGQVDSISDFIFDEPLVLLAEDGGYFDEFATRPIAQKIEGKSWVNNHAHILRVKPQKLVHEFLFQILVHRDIRKYINGSSRAKLNKSDMLSIVIEYPHPTEQRKIADFLSALDRKIDLVAQELTHARSFKAGLLQQMFV